MPEELNTPVTPQPPEAEVRKVMLSTFAHRATKPSRSSIQQYIRMEKDYAVALGLAIRKAPIIAAEWSVEVEHKSGEGDPETAEDIKTSIEAMVRPIWRDSVKHMLTAMSRKIAPFEKIFDFDDRGRIVLKRLKPADSRCVELQVEVEHEGTDEEERHFGGMNVSQFHGQGDPVEVPAWKTFWFAWDAGDGNLVGESMTMECIKRPWWSKTSEDGLYDVEDVHARKHVYDGVTVYYPDKTMYSGRDARDIAIEMGQEMLAGGVVVIPLADGQTPENSPFKIEKGGDQKKSDQIPMLVEKRDDRIFRGLLIAPQLGGQVGSTGSRSLVEVLEDILLTVIEDDLLYCCDWFSRYALNPQVVAWNWGPEWSVRISPEPLKDETKALMSDIVKSLFIRDQSGALRISDVKAMLEKSGIPVLEDVELELTDDSPPEQARPGNNDPATDPNAEPGSNPATNPATATNAVGGVRLQGDAIDADQEQIIERAQREGVKAWDRIRQQLKKKSPLRSH